MHIVIKAHGQNMIYPNFVWMSYGWYTEGWWTQQLQDTSCTLAQMERAIQRSLSVQHFPVPMEDEKDAPTDVNYVSKQCII